MLWKWLWGSSHITLLQKQTFNYGLQWVEWLEDNQRELAKVVQRIVALLEIISVPSRIKTASHSQLTEKLGLWWKPLREPVNSKQCLLAALLCSWSSEPLFIHRRIGIQSASSLFPLITNKLQFLCMWRLKANYLWETGPEESERPLAKWFTLRAFLFYRLLNLWDHCKICMYYSAFQRKNCCPARQPSALWTLWCIWDMLPFSIRLWSYFSVGGKWNEWEKMLSSVPTSRFLPPLAAAKVLQQHI